MELESDYEAFQFDLAMAYKGYLREAEEKENTIHTMLEGMRGIMRSNGAKPKPLPKPRKFIKPPKSDEIPTLEEALLAFGGIGGVLER